MVNETKVLQMGKKGNTIGKLKIEVRKRSSHAISLLETSQLWFQAESSFVRWFLFLTCLDCRSVVLLGKLGVLFGGSIQLYEVYAFASLSSNYKTLLFFLRFTDLKWIWERLEFLFVFPNWFTQFHQKIDSCTQPLWLYTESVLHYQSSLVDSTSDSPN